MTIVISLLVFILLLIFIIKDKPFRIAGTICFIIGFVIGLNQYINEYNNKKIDENFKNSKNTISIVTKNIFSDKISYFEINDKNEQRKAKKFNYTESKTLYLDRCFDSYVDHNLNKVLNTFEEETCRILDKDNNEIEYDNTIKDILNQASKLEHSILKSKILIVDDNYYINVLFNVNLWDPYSLYKYDNGKIKKIFSYDSEEVIYIKEKNGNIKDYYK